jgi:hypothetical protein
MSRGYSALRVILTGFFRDRVDVFAVQRHHPGIVGAAIAQANVDAAGQRPRFNADFQQVEAANARPTLFVGVAVPPPFGLRLSDQTSPSCRRGCGRPATPWR